MGRFLRLGGRHYDQRACRQHETSDLRNFSPTILRIVYVAGLSRFECTSLCSTCGAGREREPFILGAA